MERTDRTTRLNMFSSIASARFIKNSSIFPAILSLVYVMKNTCKQRKNKQQTKKERNKLPHN